MQIWAESGKSALPICNYSQILYQFLTFTQNLKRSQIMANPTTWIIFFTVLVNFFLSVVAFFGEEYGWRYYLQPLLQKKFGLKGGVILLGCVWAVWHLPIDFFYYTTPDMGLAALASQFVTCISLGIFMAYTYMKILIHCHLVLW